MYSSVLYSNVLYSTLLYSTVFYSTVLYSTALCSALLYSTVLYCTVLYSTLLYSTQLFLTVLYSTVLYTTLLYCTLLYTTVLYYSTVLYSISVSFTNLSRWVLGRTLGQPNGSQLWNNGSPPPIQWVADLKISKSETFITSYVFKISVWNKHHPITLSKSFLLIPNNLICKSQQSCFLL